MSMHAPRSVWSLIPALWLFTTFARADVVPPLPEDCPPGTVVDYGCGSAFCRAIVCETDADCKGGDCEPVTACFGPNRGLKPPPTEHGGPCSRGDTCSEDYLTCQTLGLCLTLGEGTTSEATTAGATTAGATTTGVTTTGGPHGTSTEPVTTGVTPTSGDASTPTTSGSTGTTGGAGSSETSGGSEGGKGCSCGSTSGPPDVLALFCVVALLRRRPRLHGSWLFVALAVACGDNVGDQTGTGSTSGATSGPTEPTSGGTGDICEDPSDVGIGPAVAVHLRNDGDADIYVEAPGGCPGATPYDLRDANDAALQSESAICPASCRNVLDDGGCECSNVGVCPVSVVRIAPGGVYDSAWSGAVHGTATLPAACLPDGCEATVCEIEEQAPRGTYTVASRHSNSIPCGPDLCSCEASSEGWCVLAGEAAAGLRLGPTEPPVEVMFVYPDTTDVTLALE